MARKLNWEDPPPTNHNVPARSAEIDAEVRALKRKPGKWAKVRTAAASGNYTTYKKRGCLTRVKHVGDNRYDIWACWPAENNDE